MYLEGTCSLDGNGVILALKSLHCHHYFFTCIMWKYMYIHVAEATMIMTCHTCNQFTCKHLCMKAGYEAILDVYMGSTFHV